MLLDKHLFFIYHIITILFIYHTWYNSYTKGLGSRTRAGFADSRVALQRLELVTGNLTGFLVPPALQQGRHFPQGSFRLLGTTRDLEGGRAAKVHAAVADAEESDRGARRQWRSPRREGLRYRVARGACQSGVRASRVLTAL